MRKACLRRWAVQCVSRIWTRLCLHPERGKKDLQDQFISREAEKLLQERGQLLAKTGDSRYVRVTADMGEYSDEAICPIISEGDVIGSVVLLNRDEKKKFGEMEQKVAQSAADFLGRQMSS